MLPPFEGWISPGPAIGALIVTSAEPLPSRPWRLAAIYKWPDPTGLMVRFWAVEKKIPAICSSLLTVTVYVGVPAGWNLGNCPCTQPLVAMLPVVEVAFALHRPPLVVASQS